MICSSWPVPSVATTSAWVSPRVNSAEPWARGRMPTSAAIGRTVRVSRPSIRRLPRSIGAAHDVLFELLEQLERQAALAFVGEQLGDLRLGRVEPVAAVLLALLAIGGVDQRADFIAQPRLDRADLGRYAAAASHGLAGARSRRAR